jgi:hypothetical protein
MIEWQSFEAAYDRGQFREALDYVRSGFDGVTVDGSRHQPRCRNCSVDLSGEVGTATDPPAAAGVEESVIGGDESPVDMPVFDPSLSSPDIDLFSNRCCPNCRASDCVEMFCMVHGVSWEQSCPCCDQDLPPLNAAPEERRNKVVRCCQQVGIGEGGATLLRELKEALGAGNESRAAEIFESGILDGPAAEPFLALACDSRRILEILKELGAARDAKRYFDLVEIWDREQNLLVTRTSAVEFRESVHECRDTNDLARRILDAWNSQNIEQLAELWAGRSERLEEFSEIKPNRLSIQRQVDQHEAWVRFTDNRDPPGEAADRHHVDNWDEDLFHDLGQAVAVADDVAAARTRLEVIDSIRERLDRIDGGELSREILHEAVRLAEDGLPEDYDYEDRERIRVAGHQLDALGRLEEAIRQGESDLAVVDAWHALAGNGGEALLRGRSGRQVVGRALEREESIRRVLQLSESDLGVEEFERQLLAEWRAGLAGCPDLRSLENRVAQATARRLLLDRIDTAIEQDDVSAITESSGDPLLRDWPFAEHQQARIEAADREVNWLDAVVRAVDNDDGDGFAVLFDAARLRRHENHDELVARRLRIEALVEDFVIPNHRNGLDVAIDGVTKPEKGVAHVKWTWPEPRFADRCRLRVCWASETDDGPSQDDFVFEQYARRSVAESTFQPVFYGDDWIGGQLVVQCMIDIGFREFTSQPLVLGVL